MIAQSLVHQLAQSGPVVRGDTNIELVVGISLFIAAGLLLSPDLEFGGNNFGPTMNGIARELLIARIELGMKYAEIAKELGKPSADAARKAVTQAVKRLANQMAADKGSASR